MSKRAWKWVDALSVIIALHYTTLHHITLHDTILYHAVLHHITKHYTTPHHTPTDMHQITSSSLHYTPIVVFMGKQLSDALSSVAADP